MVTSEKLNISNDCAVSIGSQGFFVLFSERQYCYWISLRLVHDLHALGVCCRTVFLPSEPNYIFVADHIQCFDLSSGTVVIVRMRLLTLFSWMRWCRWDSFRLVYIIFLKRSTVYWSFSCIMRVLPYVPFSDVQVVRNITQTILSFDETSMDVGHSTPSTIHIITAYNNWKMQYILSIDPNAQECIFSQLWCDILILSYIQVDFRYFLGRHIICITEYLNSLRAKCLFYYSVALKTETLASPRCGLIAI